MKALFVTTLLLSFAQSAWAHEGHGVSTSSIAHYLSGPHLWVALGAVALIVSCVWLVRRRLG